MIKKLIGSAAKIRQGRAWHCGVDRKVHHWKELAKVTKEQPSNSALCCPCFSLSVCNLTSLSITFCSQSFSMINT